MEMPSVACDLSDVGLSGLNNWCESVLCKNLLGDLAWEWVAVSYSPCGSVSHSVLLEFHASEKMAGVFDAKFIPHLLFAFIYTFSLGVCGWTCVSKSRIACASVRSCCCRGNWVRGIDQAELPEGIFLDVRRKIG